MQKCKIAERLAELRAAHGLTQSELAQELSISNKTISKWENGISTPTVGNLRKIASTLNCSVEDLMKAE